MSSFLGITASESVYSYHGTYVCNYHGTCVCNYHKGYKGTTVKAKGTS